MTTAATPLIAVTGEQALAYLRAGRPYAATPAADLEQWVAVPPLRLLGRDVDPSQLTGTVWARCELVLRSGDLAVPGPLADSLADAG
jgi:hypothetical protein